MTMNPVNLEDLTKEQIKQIKYNWYFSYKNEWECRYMTNKTYKLFFDKIINRVMIQDRVKFILIHQFSSKLKLVSWMAFRDNVLLYAFINKEQRNDRVYLDAISLAIKRNLEPENGKFECCFLSYFILMLLKKKVVQNPFRRFS